MGFELKVDEKLDWTDSKKARKALLSVSITTILLANLSLTSNEITIFGLSAHVNHQQLVSFGRLSSLVILVIFITKLAGDQIEKALENANKKFEVDLEKQLGGYQDYLVDMDDHEMSPNDEIQAQYDNFKRELLQDHAKKIGWKKLGLTVAQVTVDSAIPLGIGIIAVASPTLPLTFSSLLF